MEGAPRYLTNRRSRTKNLPTFTGCQEDACDGCTVKWVNAKRFPAASQKLDPVQKRSAKRERRRVQLLPKAVLCGKDGCDGCVVYTIEAKRYPSTKTGTYCPSCPKLYDNIIQVNTVDKSTQTDISKDAS